MTREALEALLLAVLVGLTGAALLATWFAA